MTIIKDGVQSGRLIGVTLAASNVTRITGIDFRTEAEAARYSRQKASCTLTATTGTAASSGRSLQMERKGPIVAMQS